MNRGTFFRRHFLKLMAAAGAIGLPAVRPFSPRVSHARGAPAYDPAARFDLAVCEVEFRRNSAGRMLMARIYQPKGPGPFPTVLDLHGGANLDPLDGRGVEVVVAQGMGIGGQPFRKRSLVWW